MLSRRLFSTSTRRLSAAQISKLANGISVITKKSSTPVSSVGVYLNSGARAENPYNSGVGALAGTVLSNSPIAVKALAEAGVNITAVNGKEYTGLAVASFASGSTKALPVLSELVKKAPEFVADTKLVSAALPKAVAYAHNFELTPEKMTVEHLAATAFQGTTLALPSYGKEDTLATLEAPDVADFLAKQLVSSNVAIVGYGDLEHEKLVEFAEGLAVPTGAKPEFAPTSFLGSEVRIRDDTVPEAYLAIATRTPGAQSEHDLYTGLVAAHVNGEYTGSDSLYTPFSGSQLSQLIEANGFARYYNHFQVSYSDIGLWGAYIATPAIEYLDELIHFTLKSWNRYTTGSLSEVELQKAKQELKLVLTGPKNSTRDEVSFLAQQYFSRGFVPSDEEFLKSIDTVSHKDVQKWASNYLYDQDVAVAAYGQIEGVLDYGRIRNDMSMMRW